ncbi:Uncharacterised protein [Mycobacteroides abscessus subsp. massiliense]|nr:Uncharacterised protein [Mycobacteroides abscessus subsp. massiliense]
MLAEPVLDICQHRGHDRVHLVDSFGLSRSGKMAQPRVQQAVDDGHAAGVPALEELEFALRLVQVAMQESGIGIRACSLDHRGTQRSDEGVDEFVHRRISQGVQLLEPAAVQRNHAEVVEGADECGLGREVVLDHRIILLTCLDSDTAQRHVHHAVLGEQPLGRDQDLPLHLGDVGSHGTCRGRHGFSHVSVTHGFSLTCRNPRIPALRLAGGSPPIHLVSGEASSTALFRN